MPLRTVQMFLSIVPFVSTNVTLTGALYKCVWME